MEEFSLEILLCYIELRQFQDLLDDDQNRCQKFGDLPKDMPYSSIIDTYIDRENRNNIDKDMFVRK